MTLKMKLESLDGVDESLHKFYQEGDEGFTLIVDGVEDTGALKRAKEHEKEARKEAETKAAEYQAKLDEAMSKLEEINNERSRKSGDVEALEKSWSEKYTKREGELTQQVETLQSNLREMLVDNVAGRMAAELAVEGASEVLLPHIQKRLAVEERDGKSVTVVKDVNGKPSATTLDELKEEFTNSPMFASVVVGSKGSGGGASRDNSSGGASNNLNFSRAKPSELVKHIKAKKGE